MKAALIPRTGRHGVPALVSLALLASANVVSAAGTTRVIQFANGASSATVKGSIKGPDFVDYTLRAGVGQTMTVSLESRRAFFNVLAPGSKDVAIYNSSISGNTWRMVLEASGAYTIRVYLMRNEARRGTVAPYTLTVGVAGSGTGSDAKAASGG